MLNGMMVLWIAAVILFAVIEAMTVQLVTVWFAFGAIAAVIADAAGANTTVQIIVFVGVSVLALILSRPLVKKITATKKTPTNADRIIGEEGIVTAEIDNVKATGTVKVSGSEWTARSENGETIPAGSIVTIKKIEGVKIIVSIKEEVQ